jgi:hypothetical protein
MKEDSEFEGIAKVKTLFNVDQTFGSAMAKTPTATVTK